MSVYVDHARNKFGRMLMSHMIADTEAELDEMAKKLGLKLEWKQHGWIVHYDVCETKRSEAIRKHGAIQVSSKEMVKINRKNRGCQFIRNS